MHLLLSANLSKQLSDASDLSVCPPDPLDFMVKYLSAKKMSREEEAKK